MEAKRNNSPFIELWGDGSATREFLYVDDAARGIVLAAEKYDGAAPVNLGSSMEISIKDLADEIRKIVGYEGGIKWDTSKPNGQPRRKLDVSRAKKEFGFESNVRLNDGLQRTIDWYVNQALPLVSAEVR